MIANMASQLKTLEGDNLFGLPVDTATAFCNHKGVYKRGIEKQQRKLFKKLAFLPPFLEQGEKILFVTTGCSPVSFLEQFITGAILYSIKRALFIFTDRRILHIPTGPNLIYRKSIAQILYADCQEIRIRHAKLVVTYKSGKTDKFVCIPGQARKKIDELLKSVPLEGPESPMHERAHLCPRCTKPIIRDYYTCLHCALEFKNKIKARRISIILPGGGYFYTRHVALGIMDAAGETLLSILLLMALVSTIGGDPEAVGSLVFISVILAFEKIITIIHTDKFVKEFIPRP